MNALHTITRIVAILIALWAVGVIVYFLVLARVSFEEVSISANQGEPPVSAVVSGQKSWISTAEPLAVIVVLALSLLLCAGAYAAWRGALPLLAAISILALLVSFVTGFSVGGLYFPGALALLLCTVLTGIERLRSSA